MVDTRHDPPLMRKLAGRLLAIGVAATLALISAEGVSSLVSGRSLLLDRSAPTESTPLRDLRRLVDEEA